MKIQKNGKGMKVLQPAEGNESIQLHTGKQVIEVCGSWWEGRPVEGGARKGRRKAWYKGNRGRKKVSRNTGGR